MLRSTSVAPAGPADLPPRRTSLWLLRLTLAVGFPLLLLGLLEGGLRLAGFGRDPEFFIPDETTGYYRTNPRFTELFFSASFGLKPANFRLSRAKPNDNIRVFVLGESAAMGVPEPAFALAPQLQAQLRAAFPGRTVEVYNLGVTAINSHAILRIARQAVDFDPDLLVLYMGNNEVVGPFGPGSVVTRGVPSLWFIRTSLWIRTTRIGQLLDHLIAALRPAGGFRDWRGMEMFTRNTVTADDPRLEQARANFTANLRDILDAARAHGIPVVLSTVAVNLRDCAPFASVETSALATGPKQMWKGSVQAAELAEDLGHTQDARRHWAAALSLDPGHADTHFQLASLLQTERELPSARGHFLVALEKDALRFRADPQLNDVIRRSAMADGVRLVDAARELGSDRASATEPAGAELFFEHVHFRWEGNFALARLLAPTVWRCLAGTTAGEPAWLDQAACAAAVGYTPLGRLAMARGMNALAERPPFTGQSNFAALRLQLLTEIAEAETALAAPGALPAAVAAIEAALARDAHSPFLLFQAASARLQAGQPAAALELNRRLAAEQPAAPETAAQQAFLLEALQRPEEAEQVLLRSIAAYPYYFQSYDLLAALWVRRGRESEALDYFRTRLVSMPDSRTIRGNYAQLLARRGDWPGAETQWRALLGSAPDDEAALGPLCDRLLARGATDEALALMRDAFRYNPRSFANNQRLAAIYEQRGDLPKFVEQLQALVGSGPVNALLYRDLSVGLLQLGRKPESRAAAHRGLAVLMPGDDPALLAELTRLRE